MIWLALVAALLVWCFGAAVWAGLTIGENRKLREAEELLAELQHCKATEAYAGRAKRRMEQHK